MESSQAVKKWGELTSEEEEVKLRALGRMLKEAGITGVYPTSNDHQVFTLKVGYGHTQSKLIVTGKVPHTQAKAAKIFMADAKETVLAGINPYSTLVQLDVQTVEVGSKFNGIQGLKILNSDLSRDITQVPGKILLVQFWASWCRPSLKHISEMNALSQNDNVLRIAINLDEMPEQGNKVLKSEGWTSVEHLHLGDSTADLEFGGSSMPRLLIVDTNGDVCFLGHPKTLNLQSSIDTLLETKSLPKSEEQDDVVKISKTDAKGVFSTDLSLVQVKQEMKQFLSSIQDYISQNTLLKGTLPNLLTDMMMILRQTRIDPETDTLQTKFQQVTHLAGTEQVITEVRGHLEAFFTAFGGSFTKEWEIAVVPA